MTKYHFKKLEKLFENDRKGDCQSLVSFNEAVFCLICRYQTYFRNNEQINEGYGMQASLPSTVLAELNASFEVTQEMFASPFNCFFKNYCSAFSDTDVFFGSNGSFFDFEPETGIKFFCCFNLNLADI
jgi:phosphorylated CTD-interacting factor 1